MKFNYPAAERPIEFGIHLLDRETAQIVLYATNSVRPEQVVKFQDFIQELLTRDPEELFICQMETNAENPNDSDSRLGFLTMINDYSARLGWKFETAPKEIVVVTTMVQLTI